MRDRVSGTFYKKCEKPITKMRVLVIGFFGEVQSQLNCKFYASYLLCTNGYFSVKFTSISIILSIRLAAPDG